MIRKKYKSKDVEVEMNKDILKIKKKDEVINITISEAIGLIVLLQEIIRESA